MTWKYAGKRYQDLPELRKALKKEYGEGSTVLQTAGALIITTAKGQVIRLTVKISGKTAHVSKFAS